ncbi:putative CRISPR-associated protein, partial [Magnetococcales bacterium HHB-1]
GIKAKGGPQLSKYLTSFRRANANLPLMEEKLPDRLFGKNGLTFFGELLWDHNWRDRYGEQLLEPISKSLSFSDAFRDQAATLERDRLFLLNERLDQLATHLESDGKLSNPALGFRKLEETSQADITTHVCHAWIDNKIWRLEGHFENDRFLVDKLVNQ